MFMGKVIASAIGKKSPGLALGTDIFIAAGTAIYDALAAKIANINRLLTSCVTIELNNATVHPLMSGMITAKIKGNHPNEKNAFNFLPLIMPISKRKMARKPLNRSLVNGLIPSACFALAKKPIIKLPSMSNTLPLVKECFMAVRFFMMAFSSLLNIEINKSPIMMAGDSISAIIATMCP